MTTTKEPRRATEREIELAKEWVRANNAVHPKDWDPTSEPEYAEALEIIIFANGGRYAPAGAHCAMRGDNVDAWLKRRRNEFSTVGAEWEIIDRLLDDYRDHADTGTPLAEDVKGPHQEEEADPAAWTAAGGEGVWHEFHGGPWADHRVQVETSPDAYGHLVPHRPEPGVGEWAPADAWPGTGRYVRTGSYETTVMTWKHDLNGRP